LKNQPPVVVVSTAIVVSVGIEVSEETVVSGAIVVSGVELLPHAEKLNTAVIAAAIPITFFMIFSLRGKKPAFTGIRNLVGKLPPYVDRAVT
jgi:hypothetical protein